MSASVLGNRWIIRDPAPLGAYSGPELLMRLLKLRGVESREAARPFLAPALPDVTALPNLDAAVERLAAAIRGGERIAVYGDYDADGMTATAVLVEGIGALGGQAMPYIPDRHTEGYGLNVGALRHLHEVGATLVVTVDTGTSAVEEVAYANERNLDVIVVDHHLPGAQLPDALAVVNPHLEGTPPSHAGLAGCGVAYTVLVALADRLGQGLDREQYLDLVAIGTVCDVAPLIGANRALVAAGLRQLARRARPGLAALMDLARLDPRSLDTHSIGFRIGPRLNAAGRLGHAITSYELLITRDGDRAAVLAAELERLNRERQVLTERAMRLGSALAAEQPADAPLIMVGHPEIEGGIVGLVAGRLAQQHHRPAIVYQEGAEYSVGSARSIPEFDIAAALKQGRHLVERSGGHHQAAGFKIRTERLGELRRVLTEWSARQLDWSTVVPSLTADLELPLEQTPAAILQVLGQLEPCGQENAAPVFVSRDVLVVDAGVVGGEGRHLRLCLSDGRGRRGWRAIGFGLGAHRPFPGARLDLAYSITPDSYRGGAELRLHDFVVKS